MWFEKNSFLDSMGEPLWKEGEAGLLYFGLTHHAFFIMQMHRRVGRFVQLSPFAFANPKEMTGILKWNFLKR